MFESHQLMLLATPALYGLEAWVTFANDEYAAVTADDFTIFVAFFGRGQRA
jgi:hypothetical protein